MLEFDPLATQWNSLTSIFRRPKLGLVLGGGAARAGAHAGVLQQLELIGYKPDLIVGTSMGALVASLLGTGISPTKIREILLKAVFADLVTVDRTGRGLIGNERIRYFLEEHLGKRDLRDLTPNIAVVATDLQARQSVILEKGSAVKAVLASIAIPGLFPSVSWAGRELVDGGVLNNVPTQAAYQLGADKLVAIDVGGAEWSTELALNNVRSLNAQIQRALYWLLSLSKREAAFETWVKAAMLTGDAFSQLQIETYPPDVLIRPDMPNVGLVSVELLNIAMEAGEVATKNAEGEIKRLLQQRYHTRKPPIHASKLVTLSAEAA